MARIVYNAKGSARFISQATKQRLRLEALKRFFAMTAAITLLAALLKLWTLQ